MKTIAEYMAHLTKSKAARDEFHADPTAAMTKFGLSAADQAIVATQDPAQIQAAIRKTQPAGPVAAMHITF